MSISVGGIVVIVILLACGTVAVYFAVRSYFWMRRDRSPGATDDSEAWGTSFWSRRRDETKRPPKDPRGPA